MATLSIKDYAKHSQEIKAVTLKFYEWALDRHVNRYSSIHPVSALSLLTSTITISLWSSV